MEQNLYCCICGNITFTDWSISNDNKWSQFCDKCSNNNIENNYYLSLYKKINNKQDQPVTSKFTDTSE